jgi:hypothetical protein
MGKDRPNINIASGLGKRYRKNFRDLVLQVNRDTFIFEFQPNSIELLNNVFFQLFLRNKKFIIDTLVVDVIEDYIDVYLYGVRQPQDRYVVSVVGNDIIITFVEDITRVPQDVIASDFKVKGKIVEVE